MSYFHNKFNQVDRVAIYQFIKYLEEMDSKDPIVSIGWVFSDEFRKLRQIVNFAYTHGFTDNV